MGGFCIIWCSCKCSIVFSLLFKGMEYRLSPDSETATLVAVELGKSSRTVKEGGYVKDDCFERC